MMIININFDFVMFLLRPDPNTNNEVINPFSVMILC